MVKDGFFFTNLKTLRLSGQSENRIVVLWSIAVVTKQVVRVVAGPVVLRCFAVPSLHILHVVYESLAVVVITIAASMGWVLSLGKAVRRGS